MEIRQLNMQNEKEIMEIINFIKLCRFGNFSPFKLEKSAFCGSSCRAKVGKPSGKEGCPLCDYLMFWAR